MTRSGARTGGSPGGRRQERGVVSQIDHRLSELDGELESMSELMAERRRLLQARRALTGERVSSGPDLLRRVSGDQVAEYLAGHPGSRAGAVAKALGVPLTNISQHQHRGKDTRFERRDDGWHVRRTGGR